MVHYVIYETLLNALPVWCIMWYFRPCEVLKVLLQSSHRYVSSATEYPCLVSVRVCTTSGTGNTGLLMALCTSGDEYACLLTCRLVGYTPFGRIRRRFVVPKFSAPAYLRRKIQKLLFISLR